MTKRAEKPEKVQIDIDTKGDPISLNHKGRRHKVVAVHERWRLEDGWWGDEERRCYYKIQTSHGSVYDIYHELVSDCWYLDRVYD
jgi:hypothetical protein